MRLSTLSFVNHFAFAERVEKGIIDFYIMRKKDYIQIQGKIEESSFWVLMRVGVKVDKPNYNPGHTVEFEELITSTGRPLYDLAKCLERNAYILGELRDGMKQCNRDNKLKI